MFENMNTAVAVYEAVDGGRDFIFKEFNHAAEQIEKVNADDLIGKSVLEVFPGVKEFGLFEVFVRVWKTGKSEHHPISIYKDNRIAGWRENFVYKLPSGEVVALYEDVTKRVMAEEALKISEANYRTIFDSANDAILIIDSQTGEIIDASNKVVEMIGYESKELKKMGLDSLTISEEPYTIQDGWRLLNKAATGEPQIFEWLTKGRDGRKFWAEVNLKKARRPQEGRRGSQAKRKKIQKLVRKRRGWAIQNRIGHRQNHSMQRNIRQNVRLRQQGAGDWRVYSRLLLPS